MPKGFSEREKEIIKAKLLDAGKELFSRIGLRKTTVQDLAGAAGIAKGSFYLFFESKELLMIEILKELEERIQGEILSELQKDQQDPPEMLKSVIMKQFQVTESYPLFKKLFEKEEFEYLYRKIPPEELQEGIRIDQDFAGKLLKGWQEQGLLGPVDHKLVAASFRSLFFLILHKEEIGNEIFPQLIEHMVSLVVNAIFDR